MQKQNISVNQQTGDASTDIALDTIKSGKQALIFVNSKRSAESSAEKIGKANGKDATLKLLSEDILNVLSSPTKQCRRLAYCVERGSAFHHSGLVSKQRQLIEDAFLEGKIKTISATPTLSAGVDTPAFRTIIRDVKRFDGGGMVDIPVLEYLQMAGRSGRPDFNDEYGEAIVVAKNDGGAERLTEKYIFGEPENIYSKVASMPVLRTYALSLIASEFCRTKKQLEEFFEETFFAHQYGDAKAIRAKLAGVVEQLIEWGFLHGSKTQSDGFMSASDLTKDEKLEATKLGRRVSELYLDPLTASHIVEGLQRAKVQKPTFFSILQLVTSTTEMRPLLRLRVADYPAVEAKIADTSLLVNEPSIYQPEYELFLESVKTAMLFEAWADETPEDEILDEYNVRPGELKYRLDRADWIVFSAEEIARVLKMHNLRSVFSNTRVRLKYGVKEEILGLLKFKNIGRVRARILYRNSIKNVTDVKEIDAQTLSQLIGPKTAKSLKAQVGQDIDIKAPSKNKWVGQLSLHSNKFEKS